MAKYVFKHAHLGQVYGVFAPKAGQVVDLDPGFAADGVRQQIIEPVEVPTPKVRQSGKAK